MSSSPDWVYLQCVKEKSKLRVRITSAGYLGAANCMFPRDLRVEGRRFRVHRWNINLITTRGKYYYSVMTGIEPIEMTSASDVSHVYEDASSEECAICMVEPKGVVVAPCGHLYMCRGCGERVDKCPICRGPVAGLIDKSEFA